MLGMIDEFDGLFRKYGMQVTAPVVVQTMSISELKSIVSKHEGWIIGDDPATAEVFAAGRSGSLRAAVKWGVGTDNVDFAACEKLNIPVVNTPAMFGSEVADIATGYVIALARETFQIDHGVRQGQWPKPRGISLSGKTVAIAGYGDIGSNVARRLAAAGMKIMIYDPAFSNTSGTDILEADISVWPNRIEQADFIVLTCALTNSSRHMLGHNTFNKLKRGVRIVNVGRGPLINETALIEALKTDIVYSAALDVFEVEPLPADSYLRIHPRCILGSHNASNTVDAVTRTSKLAINKLASFLGINPR